MFTGPKKIDPAAAMGALQGATLMSQAAKHNVGGPSVPGQSVAANMGISAPSAGGKGR